MDSSEKYSPDSLILKFPRPGKVETATVPNQDALPSADAPSKPAPSGGGEAERPQPDIDDRD